MKGCHFLPAKMTRTEANKAEVFIFEGNILSFFFNLPESNKPKQWYYDGKHEKAINTKGSLTVGKNAAFYTVKSVSLRKY